jgi:GH24 family phage-related lysozyme (muramidase)
MKTSDAGIALIKRWEGERLTAYLCPASVWTIGVGHTAAMGDPKPVAGMKITSDEATAILRRDLASIERDVDAAVNVRLNQRQFDTLVSFVFNVGIGAFRKSTLLKKLNASDYDAVPSELMKWTRAGGRTLDGLVNRRKAEADYWRGAPTDKQPDGAMPQAVDPPRKMRQSKEGNAALLAGGAASITAASDVAKQLQETGDSLTSVLDLLKNPNFVVLVLVVIAAGAIWYWRKQRMDKDGY